jgi:hypothetical protein
MEEVSKWVQQTIHEGGYVIACWAAQLVEYAYVGRTILGKQCTVTGFGTIISSTKMKAVEVTVTRQF